MDPEAKIRAEFNRAAELREKATEHERNAIRAALACSHGIPAYAAKILGMNRLTLKDWLRRQYADLGEEARAMRTREGYKGGNPDMYTFDVPATTKDTK